MNSKSVGAASFGPFSIGCVMGTMVNSTDPKVLANTAKHFAFTRCGELNLYGMVDAQITVLEAELLAGTSIS